MSDTTPPNTTPDAGVAPDAAPTESLPLADQQPIAVAPAPIPSAPAARSSHTRTILEVIGGVVAAGMIVIAGAVGFAVGHATGSDDGRFGGMQFQVGSRGDAMPMDPRGIDPDGDNWTGGQPGGQPNGQPNGEQDGR